MPQPTAISAEFQAALARLDPRDILNFPECADEDLATRVASHRTPDTTPEPRGNDAD
jgi:hypothetical protein